MGRRPCGNGNSERTHGFPLPACGERERARSPVPLAPGVERLEHGTQRLALVGEEIFVARGMARVEPGCDYALGLQRLKPCRERVGREAGKALRQVLEAQSS